MKKNKNETLKDQTKYIIKKNFKTSINELFFFGEDENPFSILEN